MQLTATLTLTSTTTQNTATQTRDVATGKRGSKAPIIAGVLAGLFAVIVAVASLLLLRSRSKHRKAQGPPFALAPEKVDEKGVSGAGVEYVFTPAGTDGTVPEMHMDGGTTWKPRVYVRLDTSAIITFFSYHER